MSQRFFKSTLWEKEDFIKTSQRNKLLYFFIVTRANNIGIFDVSPTLISFFLGEEITEKDIMSIPTEITKLPDGRYWMPNFCYEQYKALTPKCAPHKSYIKELIGEGLYTQVLKTYPKGIDTLQDKDKYKDPEEDEVKDKIKEKDTVKEMDNVKDKAAIVNGANNEYLNSVVSIDEFGIPSQ